MVLGISNGKAKNKWIFHSFSNLGKYLIFPSFESQVWTVGSLGFCLLAHWICIQYLIQFLSFSFWMGNMSIHHDIKRRWKCCSSCGVLNHCYGNTRFQSYRCKTVTRWRGAHCPVTNFETYSQHTGKWKIGMLSSGCLYSNIGRTSATLTLCMAVKF